ncbi:hypothetical protein AAJP47_08330 [Psychrobacter sp. B38]|uniref:hypothetical protein n=1 Tax=Psychrobacter sp. B38 TaxID=3143538 RepID=UPI00320E1907
MFNSHQRLLSKKIKTLLMSACLVGGVQLLIGCDSPSSSTADNDNAAQIDKNTEASVPSDSSASVETDAMTTNKESNTAATSLPDDQVVSPSGYQKLSFGEVVTPERLADLGLTKQASDNDQCYYVSDPKQQYMDKAYGERASVLYQIIDGKVALITIRDPSIPFYTDIKVGDSVQAVMDAHDDSLTYAVDKYAVGGDYYNLIANVNFIIIDDENVGEALTADNIKLDNDNDNDNDTLPIQIEYHLKGGQKLSANTITETDWTVETKRALQGQVESIDIGIPDAIYLVEGCS